MRGRITYSIRMLLAAVAFACLAVAAVSQPDSWWRHIYVLAWLLIVAYCGVLSVRPDGAGKIVIGRAVIVWVVLYWFVSEYVRGVNEVLPDAVICDSVMRLHKVEPDFQLPSNLTVASPSGTGRVNELNPLGIGPFGGPAERTGAPAVLPLSSPSQYSVDRSKIEPLVRMAVSLAVGFATGFAALWKRIDKKY